MHTCAGHIDKGEMKKWEEGQIKKERKRRGRNKGGERKKRREIN
jgi:hypothetical protein